MVFFYRLSGSLAAMSFFGAMFVIISYLSMPALRKHPTNMVFFLSISDLLFSLKFIVTAIYPDSDDLQKHHPSCYMQAGWAQFWGLASISWNGMISLNLIVNLHKQGFARTANLGKFYHLFVWSISCISTGIIFMHRPHKEHIGPSGDGTCWIAKGTDPLRLLFFVPLLVYFSISIVAVIFAFVRTSNGVMDDAARRGVMLRMISYVAVFLLCWSGPIIHRIYVLARNSTKEEDPHDPSALSLLDAMGVSIQGFANAMVWLTNPSFFTAFKANVMDKYLGCLFPKSEEEHPILAGINDKLADSRHDINRLDQILRKNIITCILLGIQQSLQHLTDVIVTHKNYRDTREYKHDELYTDEDDKDGHGQTFQFIDYAPLVFAHIRSLSGISTESYQQSMAPGQFLGGKLSDQLAKFSDGRSASFFIFSPDKKFIIKTVTEVEAKILLDMLESMHNYFRTNPHSLITRFYGCHAVRVSHGMLVHVVVMGNVFSSPRKIHECYDLKGSWVNRGGKRDDPSKLGMDLDLKRTLKLDNSLRVRFLDQCQKDSMFLRGCNIMDYSLLVGFHFRERESGSSAALPTGIELNQFVNSSIEQIPIDNTTKPSHGLLELVSQDESEIYYVGIIDVLQLWDQNKKMERFAKVYLLFKDKDGLSSMPPQPYAERFQRGMRKITGL